VKRNEKMRKRIRRIIGSITGFGSMIGAVGGIIYVDDFLNLTPFISILISFIIILFMTLGILIGASFIKDE